ncbi:MAG: VWA domain-containing protein [Proteobacteria bacterium]|nr:VWA domain-containing protein [Burkholderiales bacterium]
MQAMKRSDGKLEALVLEAVNVRGVLRGLLFEATVEQRFCNPTTAAIEVMRTFPMPYGAVLLGFEVELGDKRLSGIVVARTEASERYERAVCEGDLAIMLERNHDRSYTVNLGNLAPDERCVVRLRYAQTLVFHERSLRLMIPTVIAPRYGNPIIDGGLAPHQLSEPDMYAEYPFDIEVRLEGELARARVGSPTHPIQVARAARASGATLDEHSVTVSLARQGALDRDFVLVLDELALSSVGIFARDFAQTREVAVLASFCPIAPETAVGALIFKVLVDCSDSMAGDSIDAAKRALARVVQGLAAGDRFAFSRFGTSVTHLTRGLWTTTDASRLSAAQWVNDLRANMGATEMESALASTFALGDTCQADVLLLTDGQIEAIDATIETATRAGQRVFIVGIGTAPAENHLRRLAHATGGACEFIAPGEGVEAAVMRMFHRLRSRRLDNLRVEWPDGRTPVWASPLPECAFDGDTINVFGLFDTAVKGEVRLIAVRNADEGEDVIGCAALNDTLETADAVSRLAAFEWVDALGDSTQARQVAVKYQLVTDSTAVVLIEPRSASEKSAEMPIAYRVPQMMAAGRGGAGSVNAMRASRVERLEFGKRRFMKRSSDPESSRLYLDALDANARYRHDPSAFRPAPLPTGPWSSRQDAARRSLEADPADPRLWSVESGAATLTPLGLATWVSLHSPAEWPASYDALRVIGVPDRVVAWVELELGDPHGQRLPEVRVVREFLEFMKAGEQALATAGALSHFAMVDVYLALRMAADSSDEGERLEKRFFRATGTLRTVTGPHWPPAMSAMRV